VKSGDNRVFLGRRDGEDEWRAAVGEDADEGEDSRR
jgi:hypothetical protein